MNTPSVWLKVGVLYTFDWKMSNAQNANDFPLYWFIGRDPYDTVGRNPAPPGMSETL